MRNVSLLIGVVVVIVFTTITIIIVVAMITIMTLIKHMHIGILPRIAQTDSRDRIRLSALSHEHTSCYFQARVGTS